MQTGVKKNIAAGILQVMITEGTHPAYADTTGSKNILNSYIKFLIIQGDTFNYEEELSFIYDMLKFIFFGKNETSEFDIYWKVVIRAMETETAHGSHDRSHAAGDYDNTSRISHDPFISTNHLIKITMQLLEKDVLKQDVDFKVPPNN